MRIALCAGRGVIRDPRAVPSGGLSAVATEGRRTMNNHRETIINYLLDRGRFSGTLIQHDAEIAITKVCTRKVCGPLHSAGVQVQMG